MYKLTAILILAFLLQLRAYAYEVTPKDSPVQLDLYGTILANGYWNSNGIFSSDVPLWVVSGSDQRAQDKEFGIIARQTRFGIKIKGPDVGKAKLSGVLETDFFGGFPISGQAASFADLRLRLAYAKLEWTHVSFLAGQDWIILAPLNPTTYSHYAIVGFATAGNLWLRYPQFRFDAWKQTGDSKIGITAGIIRPVAGSDVITGGTLVDTAGAGERSGMPFFQSRLYYSGKNAGAGFSTHYGRENYKLGPSNAVKEVNLDSWAVAGDFQASLGAMFRVQGEIFTGSNLDSFQGGINQGFSINAPSFAEATSIRAIDTTGGWIQFSVIPPKYNNVSFNIAYGIDHPNDTDLSQGQRSENSGVMANVIWKHTKHFHSAYEYSYMKTKFKGLPENHASVINVAFGFFF
jgi:hypothetical protein